MARSGSRRRWRPLLAATVRGAAVLYPLTLLVIVLCLRYVGEAWWLSSVGLYLPRFVLGLPLLVLGPALLAQRERRLLGAQLLAAALLLFPLLGFVLPGLGGSGEGQALKVITYNVNSVAAGPEAIVSQLVEHSPDVVVLQEVFADPVPLVALLKQHFAAVEASGQFVIASRVPITATSVGAEFMYRGQKHTAHYLRHELAAPFGPVALYNVHPVSPRKAIRAVRGQGFRHEVLSGRLWRGASADTNRENSDLRELELAGIAAEAGKDRLPVIIAGDTNLPGLSPLLHRYLGAFRDGFEAGGWGFGYTYPSRLPWMRIDRILASDELMIANFEVGCGRTSDHRCVMAEIRGRAR